MQTSSHRATIMWYVIFVATFLMHGLEYAASSEGGLCYIDQHNRLVLNGEPFFPLGLFVVQDLIETSELDEIAHSPFDTLMNYNINNGTDAQITHYLNQLQSQNLKLIFSLKDYINQGQRDIDTITQKVNTFKDHPAVIGWYMNDERDPKYLPQLEAHYQKVKQLDRNHPVWSVHWNTNWLLQEAHTTDIVGVDPYPIDNHPITLVSQMADAARGAGKPLWVVPQIFSWTDYPGDFRAKTGRPPTRDEMRGMTYLAINHGAKGLIYYSYFNIRDDADFHIRWPQIKEIAREVDSLRSAILSTEKTNNNDIVCNNRDIDFHLMRKDDAFYLSAVNTKKKSLPNVSFKNKVVNKPQVIRVLFEDGREIHSLDGNFTDDFSPYRAHIYHWKLVSP